MNDSKSTLVYGERKNWLNDTMNESQTRFHQIQKVTPNVVRTIFDSCYLRPEENPRVINYFDPAKAYIINDATNRYE